MELSETSDKGLRDTVERLGRQYLKYMRCIQFRPTATRKPLELSLKVFHNYFSVELKMGYSLVCTP